MTCNNYVYLYKLKYGKGTHANVGPDLTPSGQSQCRRALLHLYLTQINAIPTKLIHAKYSIMMNTWCTNEIGYIQAW